jgi:hypothetical protein
MGSAPDTTLGLRVFGVDYFPNNKVLFHEQRKCGIVNI